jgi:hypothetical protein
MSLPSLRTSLAALRAVMDNLRRSLCRLCLSRGAELWNRNIDVSGVVKQVVYSGVWTLE